MKNATNHLRITYGVMATLLTYNVSHAQSESIGSYQKKLNCTSPDEVNPCTNQIQKKHVQSLVNKSDEMSPSASKSLIIVDKQKYIIGDTIIVTVSIKNLKGHPIPTHSHFSESASVMIPGALMKENSVWSNQGDGVWTSEWVADEAAILTKAYLHLKGQFINVMSEGFSIMNKEVSSLSVLPQYHPFKKIVKSPSRHNSKTSKSQIDGVKVNGHIFKLNEGFPVTGFKGAKFSFVLKNAKASDLIWQANVQWITINSGNVEFTDQGTADEVIITARLPNNTAEIMSWSFSLHDWFYFPKEGLYTWQESVSNCKKRGYKIPTSKLLITGMYSIRGLRGATGALWDEWGPVEHYFQHEPDGYVYWTSSLWKSGYHLGVGLHSGSAYINNDRTPNMLVCHSTLKTR